MDFHLELTSWNLTLKEPANRKEHIIHGLNDSVHAHKGKGIMTHTMTMTRIVAMVPSYGTKVINGTSTLKLGLSRGDSTDEFIADMLKRNGWVCVSDSSGRSPYSYWAPCTPVPSGGRPVVWLDVPTDGSLRQMAAELHEAGVSYKDVIDGVTYEYRPARISRWEDKDGIYETPYDASFHAKKLWWSVLCWFEQGGQRWFWWGPESTGWRRIPDKAEKRIVLV